MQKWVISRRLEYGYSYLIRWYVQHAQETCAPILDSRHTPNRNASARGFTAWSLITYCSDGDRDRNDLAALKAERKQAD
jgi:hypothetical protein